MKIINWIIVLFACTVFTCLAQKEDSSISRTSVIELEEKGLEKVSRKKMHTDQSYFMAVDVFPEPIGGINGIQDRMKYPTKAIEKEIEGKVYVLAFVNESGDVDSAQVIKGIGGGCDEEALRAVRETKFTSGKHNGENVKVQVAIPIIFKLNPKK